MSRAFQNDGSSVDRQQTLSKLSGRIRSMERSAVHKQPAPNAGSDSMSTGIDALDRMLPDGGILPGSVWEWLAAGDGGGAGTISLAVAAHVMRQQASVGELVIVDKHGEVYPPAMVPWRIPPERTVIVQPSGARESLWTLEQSLRCRGVAVTIGWIDQMADHAYRRLQLAAQRGGGVGLLIRAAQFRRSACWADARLLVTRKSPAKISNPRALDLQAESPDSRLLTLELISYGHGSLEQPSIEVDVDDHTGTVREIPQLASATRAG